MSDDKTKRFSKAFELLAEFCETEARSDKEREDENGGSV